MRQMNIRRWGQVTVWVVLVVLGRQIAMAQAASAFSPDNGTFATVRQRQAIALWDVKTGVLRTRLTGHQFPIYDLAFASDGSTLASWNQFGEVILWNAQAGKRTQWLHRSRQNSVEWNPVAFSQDGKAIAIGDTEWETDPQGQKQPVAYLRIWDAHTGTAIKTVSVGAFASLNSIHFWPDGRHVTLGVRLGTQVWDWKEGHRDWIVPNGSYGSLVGASADGRLVVTCGPGQTMTRPVSSPLSPSGRHGFNSLGHEIASGPKYLTPEIWDVAAHRKVARLVGHTYSVDRACFSPDQRIVVTRGSEMQMQGDMGGNVVEGKAWDAHTGQLLWAWGKDEDAGQIRFSPDSRFLLSRGRILNTRTGQVVRTLEGATDATQAVYSPDGKTIAATRSDLPLYWDAQTGKRIFISVTRSPDFDRR